MLHEHKGVFAYGMVDLKQGYHGPLGAVRITMVHNNPIWQSPRRYSPLERGIIAEKSHELLSNDIAEAGDTTDQYAFNPVLAPKKDVEGNWVEKRFCIDFSPCNKAQRPDKYQTARPEEMFAWLAGRRVISHLDMRAGFHQIPLHPDSRRFSQFWANGRLLRYTRLPYGFINATAEFQKRCDDALQRGGVADCARSYVDDLVIASATVEDHIRDVARVLRALEAVNFKIHPAKSFFFTDRLPFLGHFVTPDGREPEAAKVAAIMSLPLPRNRDQLQSMLGLLGYYRAFIPNYAHIAAPLTDLLRKDAVLLWRGPLPQRLRSSKPSWPGRVTLCATLITAGPSSCTPTGPTSVSARCWVNVTTAALSTSWPV
jgi:hypothetical protein